MLVVRSASTGGAIPTPVRAAFSTIRIFLTPGHCMAGCAAGIGTLGMAPIERMLRSCGAEVSERELAVPDLYAEQFGAIARATAGSSWPPPRARMASAPCS